MKANENRENSVSEEENEGRGGGELAAVTTYRSVCATGKFLKKKAALNRMGSGEQSQP